MFSEFRKEVESLVDEYRRFLEVPKDNQGDLALPCFHIAKLLKKQPQEIAKELEARVSKKLPPLVKDVKAIGPYLNFYINYDAFTPIVLRDIAKKRTVYGSSNMGNEKVVIVEYSSPNIAKPLTIGHLSTTIMGQSLYNIYKFLGYRAISDNHIGDWGTQFGKLLYAFKKWGSKEAVEKNPIEELLGLYVRFHAEAEKDEYLEEEGRAWFKKLEDGDKEANSLWKWFRELSLREFERHYKRLGVHFDYTIGESFYTPMLKPIIEEALKRDIAKEDNGAVIVAFDDMPTTLIQKSDGATLYQTRDLATIKYQKDKFHFWKRVYVVGSEQKLYFRQVFRIAELMGYVKNNECIHVDVGQISLPTGRISTRKGNVVFMEDVINKTVELAEKVIKEKNPDLKQQKDVAEKVGLGAIKYFNLSRDRARDVVFDIDQILSFEGDTGPYIQYTYARAGSILKKSKKKPSHDPKFSDAIELDIVRKLSLFPDVVERAAAEYRPNLIANYVFDLATAFNGFYHSSKVVGSDNEEDKIALITAVMQVIENSLRLLGIDVVSEM
jgi:arginyl-tRNA synthetase